uniref:Uncharacterized protein n=1 Tax=Ditylenchus dipsaci TaxID=166011 RepID=A0A915DBJ5_9BILA
MGKLDVLGNQTLNCSDINDYSSTLRSSILDIETIYGPSNYIEILYDDEVREICPLLKHLPYSWSEDTTFRLFFLLDPLLLQLDKIKECSLRQFCSAIFYVGKESRYTPAQTFKDARIFRNLSEEKKQLCNEKLERILNIWKQKKGVIYALVPSCLMGIEMVLTFQYAIFSALNIVQPANEISVLLKDYPYNKHNQELIEMGVLLIKIL